MEEIKDSISKDYGIIDLYFDDLLNLISIFEENFDKYELEIARYEITENDKIKEALDKIKDLKGNKFHEFNIRGFSIKKITDYTSLTFKLEKNTYIYSKESSILIRGLVSEIEDIITPRINIIKNLFNNLKINFIISVLVMIFLYIGFYSPLSIPMSLKIFGMFLLVLWLGILILTFFFKSNINLVNYNSRNSFFSKRNILKHISKIVYIIIGAFITMIIQLIFNL